MAWLGSGGRSELCFVRGVSYSLQLTLPLWAAALQLRAQHDVHSRRDVHDGSQDIRTGNLPCTLKTSSGQPTRLDGTQATSLQRSQQEKITQQRVCPTSAACELRLLHKITSHRCLTRRRPAMRLRLVHRHHGYVLRSKRLSQSCVTRLPPDDARHVCRHQHVCCPASRCRRHERC
jgi:hypothetical protein